MCICCNGDVPVISVRSYGSPVVYDLVTRDCCNKYHKKLIGREKVAWEIKFLEGWMSPKINGARKAAAHVAEGVVGGLP